MKEYFVWTKKISVGISEIDEQHKKFISMINDAHGIAGRGGSKKLVKIAKDIVYYADVHFSTEEGMLERWSYPFLPEHRREHERIFHESAVFYERISDEGVKALRGFLDFLKNWFEKHLSEYDMRYANYYRQMGFIGAS